MTKSVKLQFQRKTKKRFKCTVKARFPEIGHKTIPLGYINDHKTISDVDKKLITKKLEVKWKELTGISDVMIDWKNAKAKWELRDEKQNKIVDRSAAIKQIFTWVSNSDEVVESAFSSKDKNQVIRTTLKNEDFYHQLNKLDEEFASRLITHVDITIRWWNEEEVPRLLCRFFHYTNRETNAAVFCRKEFLAFLKRNIHNGWATGEWNRRFREPMHVSIDNQPEPFALPDY